MQIGYGLTDAQKGGEQQSTQIQQHKISGGPGRDGVSNTPQ